MFRAFDFAMATRCDLSLGQLKKLFSECGGRESTASLAEIRLETPGRFLCEPVGTWLRMASMRSSSVVSPSVNRGVEMSTY